ncbi:MAG: DUF5786 family protein [Halolamina sp.]
MGFGSYDESEQENQNLDDDEEKEGVDVDGGEEGDLSFESSESTDELVGKLEQMRDDGDDE